MRHFHKRLAEALDNIHGVPPKVSKRQQKRDTKAQGSRVVYDNGGYQIVEITTPEAMRYYAMNTNWGVKDPRMAASYLQSGPFYLVKRDNQPVALRHCKAGVFDSGDREVGSKPEAQAIQGGEYDGLFDDDEFGHSQLPAKVYDALMSF